MMVLKMRCKGTVFFAYMQEKTSRRAFFRRFRSFRRFRDIELSSYRVIDMSK